MNDADSLQDTESAKRDERNTFIALLAPHSQYLRYEKQRITQQSKTEYYCDNLLQSSISPETLFSMVSLALTKAGISQG
jgi:hypothetical protein